MILAGEIALRPKYCHFDNILVIDCTESWEISIGAAIDEYVVKMKTLLFQCITHRGR